jgi:predicted ATPase
MMISYRRDDSAGITGRIFDHLSAHFGPGNVFMDVDAIPIGVDFHQHIDATLKAVEFLIVVIGPRWSGERTDGTHRVDDPADLVRIEIETGLHNGLRIVPVLVDDARMPTSDSLPETLRELASLNATRVEPGVDFRNHIARLIRALSATERPTGVTATLTQRTPGNLPQRRTALIGRVTEIEAIESLLGDTGLVTVTGAGGIGKTSVALQAAAGLRGAYADGTWFVDLAPLRSEGLVAGEIASTLGVRQSASAPVLESVIDYCKRRELLLVIDNCEHLIAEAAGAIDAILKSCPNVHVIATSREPLDIEDERMYPLPSLAVPSIGMELTPDVAQECDSVALFLQRAVAARPDFALTDESAPIVGEICRRLDGIALAIELAAARIDVLSVREIRDRLGERLRILTDGRRTAAPRQQTMRAAIDWSYELLSDVDRTIFRRVAVFDGGCTLEAAVSVCALDEMTELDVLESLSSLSRKSLLVVELLENGTRYRMLESTRAYALEKASSELISLSGKHAAWTTSFVEFSGERAWTTPQHIWLPWFDAENDNIRQVLSWALEDRSRTVVAGRIVSCLPAFWYEAGLPKEGHRWLEAVLANLDEEREPAIAGRSWSALAAISNARNAVVAGRKAVELLGRAGTNRDQANCHTWLAFGLWQVGELSEAAVVSERAVDLYAAGQLKETRAYGSALAIRANILRARDRYDEARPLLAEAISTLVAFKDEIGAASVRGDLAELEFARGSAAAALSLVREATASFRRLGAFSREATSLVNSATYLLDLGQIEEAGNMARAGLTLAYRAGDSAVVAVALQDIAAVHALTGDTRVAARLIGFVDEWYRAQGLQRDWSEAHVFDVVSDQLRVRLSEEDFRDLTAAGARLTEEQAIVEAC